MNSTPLPKKAIREKFHKAGLDRRINELLSAAYLLHSVAYLYYDEADELLKQSGFRMSQTKQLNIDLRRAYNRYFRDFAELVERTDAGREADARTCKRNYYADLDRYTPVLQKLIRHTFALDIKDVEEAINKDKQEAEDDKQEGKNKA